MPAEVQPASLYYITMDTDTVQNHFGYNRNERLFAASPIQLGEGDLWWDLYES